MYYYIERFNHRINHQTIANVQRHDGAIDSMRRSRRADTIFGLLTGCQTGPDIRHRTHYESKRNSSK